MQGVGAIGDCGIIDDSLSSSQHHQHHRRRRKSSSTNLHVDSGQPRQQQHQQQYGSPSKSSKGLWSYFKRRITNKGEANRRGSDIMSNSNHSIGGDTLLPKSYNNNNHQNSSMNSQPLPKKNISSTTRACMNINNSFLLGAIDKRRYRRKKRSLCYRIFWSSLPRRLLVGFVVLYLVVFHIVIPLATICLFGITTHDFDFGFGTGKTGRDILARLEHDPTLTQYLPSLRQERIRVGQLQRERLRLEQQHNHHPRDSILEQIVPHWYHRNDMNDIDTTTTTTTTMIDEPQPLPIVVKDENSNEDEEKEKGENEKKENIVPNKKTNKNRNTTNKSGVGEAQHETGEPEQNVAAAAEIRIAGQPHNKEDQGREGDHVSSDVHTNDSTADSNSDTVSVDVDADADADADADTDADAEVFKQKSKNEQQQTKKRYHVVVDKNNNSNNEKKTGNRKNNRILQVKGGIAIDTTSTTTTTGEENDNIAIDNSSMLLPLRTIHNQQNLAAIYSSCGSTGSVSSTAAMEDANNSTTTTTTTLVVQTSIDRMWILQETCKRWKTDPIIAVVFLPHSHSFKREAERTKLLNTLDRTEKLLLQQHSKDYNPEEMICPNLQIIRYLGSTEESIVGQYPVNRLRNVGLDLVTTRYVLMMDIDFVPSQELDSTIRKNLLFATTNGSMSSRNNNNTNKNKRIPTTKQQPTQQQQHTAYIVPAFERTVPSDCVDEKSCAHYLRTNSNYLPHTYEELQQCFNYKSSNNKKETNDANENYSCLVFQSEYNWDGHSTTRSKQWINEQFYETADTTTTDNDNDGGVVGSGGGGGGGNSSKGTSFRTIPCFDTARYEPYVVLEWCPSATATGSEGTNHGHGSRDTHHYSAATVPVAPYYDERFYGYGKNKIEVISHLRMRGYTFQVLPHGYIIHNPHPESNTKVEWNNNTKKKKSQATASSSSLHQTMDHLYNQIFMKELYTMYYNNNKPSLSSSPNENDNTNNIIELCHT